MDMKVNDIMTREVQACHPGTDLSEAAMVMWRYDCGVAPVTDDDGRVVGMITDRDICMAVATQHRPAHEIHVSDVTSGEPITVRSTDSVETAMDRMKARRVRRVPVVNERGMLAGVLSLNDLLLHAELGASPKSSWIPAERVLEVARSICQHEEAEHSVHA
jgi:CBS domain-containing protein